MADEAERQSSTPGDGELPFYEPLQKLKAVVESGVLGLISSYHMKMVASGRGAGRFPAIRTSGDSNKRATVEGRSCSTTDGTNSPRTVVVRTGQRSARLDRFDRDHSGIEVDAPTTVIWEHVNGVRACGISPWPSTCTFAPTTTPTTNVGKSPGRRGFARVNRCTGRGIQEPSFEIYLDGEMRSYHALDDDWASSFRDSGTAFGSRRCERGKVRSCGGADQGPRRSAIRLAAYQSSAAGASG